MDTLSAKIVKTRKVHTCWGCRKTIPLGTPTMTVTTADGGMISTVRWCCLCDKVWEKHWRDIDPFGDCDFPFGFIADEYPDYLSEAAKEQK